MPDPISLGNIGPALFLPAWFGMLCLLQAYLKT